MQLFKDLFRTKPIVIIIEVDYNIGDVIFSFHNSIKAYCEKKIASVVFDFVEKKVVFRVFEQCSVGYYFHNNNNYKLLKIFL